jgi:hypothetical protein
MFRVRRNDQRVIIKVRVLRRRTLELLLRQVESFNFMRALLLGGFLMTLVGCVSQRAVLVNDRGEELTCEASGWGFIGSLATPYKQNECLAEAEKRGYRLKNQSN